MKILQGVNFQYQICTRIFRLMTTEYQENNGQSFGVNVTTRMGLETGVIDSMAAPQELLESTDVLPLKDHLVVIFLGLNFRLILASHTLSIPFLKQIKVCTSSVKTYAIG